MIVYSYFSTKNSYRQKINKKNKNQIEIGFDNGIQRNFQTISK